MSERGTWVYQADITNGAGGAGAHTYTLTTSVGSEAWIVSIEVFNGDTTGRTIRAEVDDGTNRLGRLMGSRSLGAAALQEWPSKDPAADANSMNDSPYPLSGGMRLQVTISAVALSQDTACAIVARIRGNVPTVVEAGASTPTINVNTERMF